MSLGKNVRKLREARGWEQKDLALASGVSNGTISAIEVRDSRRSAVAPALARALGVTLEQLMSEDMDALVPAPIPEPSSAAPVVMAPTPAPGELVVRVPLLANAGSMGVGTDVQHDDILVGQIDLSEQWVAQRIKPSSPSALRFVHAYGDSMSPTFEDGDVLLVDTGMRDPRHIDGVYVMAANDRMYIKRVRQRMDGSVEISSDNATVKTVDVLNGGQSIDVLGRVVWAWNGRKL